MRTEQSRYGHVPHSSPTQTSSLFVLHSDKTINTLHTRSNKIVFGHDRAHLQNCIRKLHWNLCSVYWATLNTEVILEEIVRLCLVWLRTEEKLSDCFFFLAWKWDLIIVYYSISTNYNKITNYHEQIYNLILWGVTKFVKKHKHKMKLKCETFWSEMDESLNTNAIQFPCYWHV